MRADAPDHRLAKCAICINTYELPKGRRLGAGIKTECEAGPMADAIALSEGISWPLDAVRMRILDANGREVQERDDSQPLEPIGPAYCDRLLRGSVHNVSAYSFGYGQPTWVTLALFLKLRSDQSSSNPLCGTKWFDSHFLNVTVGSDRDDHTAVPSISGSAGLYAGAACTQNSVIKALGFERRAARKPWGSRSPNRAIR